MGKINYGRVILGGLLAGIVITIGEFLLNYLILADDWEAFMSDRGLGMDTGATMAMYVVLNFAIGIILVWLYAAVRPRFGPGPRTAIITGLFLWLTLWLLGFGSMGVSFLIPGSLILVTLIWGIFEVCLAALAGAWAYKEGAEPVSSAQGPASAPGSAAEV